MPSKVGWGTIAVGLMFAAISVIFAWYPINGIQAAAKGISIWWDVLFPALFPFFVISELMLGFGVVHFFGALLDPLMRPLFRVPGIGGFVMAMGFASGYPVGAKLSAQLWDQRLITRTESERLVAFTTSSDPIFLIGAVSIGFFRDVTLAPVLAAAHYGSALVVGLMMRFYTGGEPVRKEERATQHQPPLVARALQALHRARIRDGRPFGLLLRQAIESSLRLMFVVGGLVVFFSVVLEALTVVGVMELVYAAVTSLLGLVAMPPSLAEAIVNGFFEVTLGARSAGTAAQVTLQQKAAIGAFVLSWAGLSVHAQIVSLLSRTGFRYGPFALARLFHALLASTIVYTCWEPLQLLRSASAAWLPAGETTVRELAWSWSLPASGLLLAATLLALTAISIIAFVLRNRIGYDGGNR